MDRLKVRLATVDDSVAIWTLISDYYARRGAPTQTREAGTWYVVENANGVIHAAQNRADTDTDARWILDTYAFDTRAGKRALATIISNSYEEADRDNVTLLGVSELDNLAIAAIQHHHGWTDVGILRRREPNAPRRALGKVS